VLASARSCSFNVAVAGWCGGDETRRLGGVVPRLDHGEQIELVLGDEVADSGRLVTD